MSDSNEKTVYTLKIRGGRERDEIMKNKGGRGALLQTNISGTLGTSQDQTLFVPKVINSSGGIAGTLDSNYFKGCGVREGIEREFIAVKKDNNELPKSI